MAIDGMRATTGGAPATRRPERRHVVAVALVLMMTGGLVTFLAVRAHYRDATPLSCACGLRWAEPDSGRVREVRSGSRTEEVVTARPGGVQAFEVLLVNTSSVTQTVVGAPRDDGQTAEPVDVTFARPSGSSRSDQDPKSASDFSERTAVFAPGALRWVRFAIHTAAADTWSKGAQETFIALDLKVRVGAWTRWEHIGFANLAAVLVGA